MKNLKLMAAFSLAIAGTALLGVPALAQQAPAGQHGHMGMRFDPVARLTKELNLTAEQQNQIRSILQNNRQQFMALRQNTSLNQEQKAAQMKSLHASELASIKSVLTAEQAKKFEAMGGLRGGRGFGMMGMLNKLNLSAEQKAKIDSIMKDAKMQMAALNKENLSDADRRSKSREIMTSHHEAVMNVLSNSQKAQLKALLSERGQHARGQNPPPSR